jgi:hypothetical protein
MIPLDFAHALASDWVDAWNQRDVDRVLTYYTDDVVFDSPTVVTRWNIPDGKLRGKEKLREHFIKALETNGPAFKITLVQALTGVSSMTIHYIRETGVHVIHVMLMNQARKAAQVYLFYGPRT